MSIKVLISIAFIDLVINHDQFVLINNGRKEYNDMKQETKNLKASTVYQRFQSIYKTMLSYCLKCRKNTESKNPKDPKDKKEEE